MDAQFRKQLTQSQISDIMDIIDGKKELYDLEELYDILFSYYCDSGTMPYGTMKARDGDPYEWITNELVKNFD